MLETLGTANFVLLSIWFVLSLALLTLRGPIKLVLDKLDPEQASAVQLLVLAIPVLASLSATVLLYHPQLGRHFLVFHCHGPACGHHHPPMGNLPTLGPLSLLITAAALGLVLLRSWQDSRANLRFGMRIHRFCKARAGFWEINEQTPLAFTIGLLKPQIVLSTGLLHHYSKKEVDIVLLHEQGHRLNHDNLRILIARLLSLPLPGARYFISELRLSIEKSCDLHASRYHDRSDVARCIIKFAAASKLLAPSTYCAFATEAVEQRVENLLKPAPKKLPVAVSTCLALSSAALLCLSVTPLHHCVEWLMLGLTKY